MKIAVESSVLIVKNKTGVEYYSQDLLQAAVAIDKTSEYQLTYLAFPGRPVPDLGVRGANVKAKRVWWLPGKVYNAFLRLPIGIPIDLLSGSRPDVFFFPNFVRWPLLYTKKSVLVVHDVSFVESGQTMVKRHRKYLARVVPRSIQKASAIVSISQSTKDQIIRHYGTNPDKITVIHPAVDHNRYKPSSESDIQRTKKKYAIEDDYLLYIGTLEPRKNVSGIIRAYLALPESIRYQHKLVLAGGRGWLDSEINELAAQVPDGQLVKTGYVDYDDMPHLYSGATIFLYPSFYEGWGMQVLESMACGTPVVTSNNSSLPEVGGKAAHFIDPHSNTQLASAIETLLGDPQLLMTMRKKGIRHAAGFNWERSARRLVEVLHDQGESGH